MINRMTKLSLRATTVLALTNVHLAQGQAGEWQKMTTLPDGEGYGGMFAGTIGGQLVAGGGSRFDRPVWLGGTKSFSDSLFILQDPESAWRRIDSALPYPVGHAAFASTDSGIIVAGGLNDSGAQNGVFLLSLDGKEPTVTALTPMPHTNAYGAGAVAGDYFYIAGGAQDSAALTQPTPQCWRLPLTGGDWERLPDIPGEVPLAPAMASDGTRLYVLGGIAYQPDADGKPIPAPLTQAFCFDPQTHVWTQIENLPAARVAPAAALLPSGEIFVVGGYAKVHQGSQQTHPGFDAETFLYDPTQNAWHAGPSLPRATETPGDQAVVDGPLPPIAAPLVHWDDRMVLVGGEVLPTIRTGTVLALPLGTSAQPE